ncbi:MAG: right-handed parallel beta-helix repeat-containing protein [Dehalococcoidia bacterium]
MARRRRGFAFLFVLIAVGTLLGHPWPADEPRAAGPVTIVVTSAADGTAPAAVCPDDTRCTLRRAIEVANADVSGNPVVITFSPATFPGIAPALIAPAAALPAVTRVQTTIDAAGLGVILDGGGIPGAHTDGITFAAPEGAVRGLILRRFTGACIAALAPGASIGGDLTATYANRLDDCATGVLVRGTSAQIAGNRIGLASSAGLVQVGILVAAGDVTIGGLATAGPFAANTIGNAVIAIRVGEAASPAFGGVTIARNVIGLDGTAAAPVGTGVAIGQNSSNTRVVQNTITNAGVGVSVAADAAGVSVTGNRIQSNRFGTIPGLAVDLGADGVYNPSDPGDVDNGPNRLINRPVITRATQARVTGEAGAACPGCTVELYRAAHAPGSLDGNGLDPVPTPLAIADTAGGFTFEAPPVAPGEWLTALVTDANGNTSEFGPQARVGTGVAQCGNTALVKGWNQAAYFGPSPVQLGNSFPNDASPIRAIYHLEDGTANFTRWIAGQAAGRTLTGLTPGEVYWFLADGPVTIPGGFSLTTGLPVPLRQGWNDFVYIGGSAAVADALASLGATYTDLYRFDAATGSWRAYGSAATPEWAHQFGTIESCAAYQVYMNGVANLTPLQP